MREGKKAWLFSPSQFGGGGCSSSSQTPPPPEPTAPPPVPSSPSQEPPIKREYDQCRIQVTALAGEGRAEPGQGSAPEPSAWLGAAPRTRLRLPPPRQVRLLDGTSLTQTFRAKEQLAAVRLYVELNRKDGGEEPFHLLTSFPRRVFTEEDMEKPLQELGESPVGRGGPGWRFCLPSSAQLPASARIRKRFRPIP